MRWMVETATELGGRMEQQDRVIALHTFWWGEDMIVLADGMGGHRQGAQAAQTVIDTARRLFRRPGRLREPGTLLGQICEEAHRRIRALAGEAATADARARPGSTCVLLYLRRDQAYWLHLGDSRFYHFRGTHLLDSTRDHSLVQLLRDQSPDTPAPVGSNLLYACLGSDTDPLPVLDACSVTSEDWFLLCSDGFWNRVTPEETAQLVCSKSAATHSTAARLAALAAQRGGAEGDNVSLALIRQRSPRPFGWPFKIK